MTSQKENDKDGPCRKTYLRVETESFIWSNKVIGLGLTSKQTLTPRQMSWFNLIQPLQFNPSNPLDTSIIHVTMC